MTIEELLAESRSAILDEAAAAVTRAHLASYEKSEVSAAERLAAMLDVTTSAIATRKLDGATDHARLVAHQRYQDGFDLAEVQTAINVLEEAIWRHVLARIAPLHQGQALGLVSTVLGAIKDTLAREYLSAATRSHAATLDLRALFAGTQRA